MRKQAGFTLIELLTVIGIIGILAATAVPLFRTYQQRTYGREAVIMAKQILDAQVMYFLEHNKFFPEDASTQIEIYHDDSPTKLAIEQVKTALNVHIPVGHFLNFQFYPSNTQGDESFSVTISSYGHFPLFRGGVQPDMFVANVDKTGKFTFIIPE